MEIQEGSGNEDKKYGDDGRRGRRINGEGITTPPFPRPHLLHLPATAGQLSVSGLPTLRLGGKIRMYNHSVLVITNVFYVNVLINIYYCQVYFAEIMKFDVKYICYDSN